MTSPSKSYVIVGAGVFGVSTAYYLKKKYPNASVTLVDRDAYDADTRVAASWDWNKVVRADYDDIVYCQMCLEAQDIFKSDPLWQPYFHETGIFWMCRSDYARDVIENYKKLGRKADIQAVPVEEARKMYDGLFDAADYTDVKEVLVNRTSGWGAAGDCLVAVTKAAIDMGVRYVNAEVSSLEFDGERRCIGVRTPKGTVIHATNTILSTGAYTAKLLEQSAQRSGISSLRAGSKIVAAGITTGMKRLSDEEYSKYANMPVGMQGYRVEQGTFLGSLPPTKDKELKWWGKSIFSNTQEVSPGNFISMPPTGMEYKQWDISRKMVEDIDHASKAFYGDRMADWKFEKHRVCWDSFTASGDFIISPHSASPGLYIATCGNFHGWKFFPVLGKYIVQMLDGELPENLLEKWSWDRDQPDPKFNPDYPRIEMRDMLNVQEARL